MPRIDPHQLLKCLSVLLSPTGGVKSKDEVQRLANLMTKFSKKLVSKCIYVSILKATDIELLNMFMAAGGWDLTFSWLSDGVSARNWPLVSELVELLLICPVDIDRLKTNSCPKLIKTLSKDLTAKENVRELACRLVEQWLRIVRGDDHPILPSRIEEPQSQEDISRPNSNKPEEENSLDKSMSHATEETDTTDGHLPKYKITIRDGKQVLTEINNKGAEDDSSTETSAVEETEPPSEEIEDDDDDDEDYVIKPVKLNKKPAAAKGRKAAKVVNKKERVSTDSGGSTGKSSKDSGKPSAKKSKTVDQTKSKAEDKKGKVVDQVKGKSAKNKTAEAKAREVAGTKKGKESEEATGTKQKDTGKMNLSLKSRKRIVAEKEHGKFDKLHAKDKSKTTNSIMDMDTLTDKEKETLSKFITPPISKLGKIPKKTSMSKEEKPLDDKNKTSKGSNDVKSEARKLHESKKEDSKHDLKKVVKSPVPEVKKEKKWSIEPKRALPTDQKPKTAKIFSAKFRSTGLEEEITKPPIRKDIKDHPKKERPPPPLLPSPTITERKPLKRSSPPPPEIHIPEKKAKPESPVEEKKHTEKPGIKLIPPKPRPMFLQESDVFMDAMLAANTLKEPRKRKRKGSLSKDHPEPKKEGGSPNHSPSSGGGEDPNSSPSAVKPTFKFYQDTMDTSMEEDKADDKMDDENLEFAEPNADEIGDDQKSMSSEEDKSFVPRRDSGGMKGVLVHLKTRKPKKCVTWKEIGLEAIRYFELDENERVNVTKNFTDMKNHEKELEREHFLIARKLAAEDIMEERTRWQALIPIDMSSAAAVVAAGKNSQEKEIQYAREKTVPAAIYFNRIVIPDCPAEPDLEIRATTDPTIIPLEDITGSVDSTNDFTSTPWPEPKGAPPPPPAPAPVPPPGPGLFAPPSLQGPGPAGPFPPMPGPGPFMPGPPGPGMPMPPGGDWRTGDGNVVDMPPGPPGMFPGPMMPPGMPMPMMMPLMSIPTNMNPEDMPPGPPFHPGPFPLMGPQGPGPFQGPPGPGPQGNWQGPPQGPPNGPNWDGPQQGPPPQSGDRGGRYQGGGGGGSWRGSRGTDNWNRGNSQKMCNKGQFCRNNNCRFRHPR